MKQLTIGNSAEYDLNGTALPGVFVKLNADNPNYVENDTAHYVVVSLHIGTDTKPLDATANITVTPKVGSTGSAASALISHVKTVLAGLTIVMWQTDPILLTAVEDSLRIYVHSDNANDVDVTVVATVMEASPVDANGRVDLGSALGEAQTVSATGKKLMVDMYSSGDATPMSLTDILGKVYEGLSSVVTTIAVADSTTSFTLASGAGLASAYLGQLIAIKDADDDHIEAREIITYASGRVVTVNHAFSFTPAVDDAVWILNIVGSAHQLNTAIPGSPAVNSINEKLKILPSKNLKSFMDKH